MIVRLCRIVCLCLCCLIAGSTAGWAQESHLDAPGEIPKYVRDPIPLYTTGLGPFHRPITTTNKEAQAFFDQGFQMMYSFAKPEAVRSFREAWKRDADCAICYWGEAWAWGSYLNGPMNATEAPHAYAALQKAIKIKDKATPKERAFIEALSVRYVEKFEASKRVEQDRVYAEAMRKLSEQYPDDLEALTLYGDALFLLEPRRGARDANSANVKRLHGVLEQVLAKDIRHPGACHLYIHATESTQVPGKAEACAEFLGNAIPGASHINHMPSHTFNQVGRWGDAVRGNMDAWHSDLKAGIGEGFAIYPEHNLHMLLFSASFDGQGAVAIQAGKDYAKNTKDSMYHALTLVRFGRFDEVAAVSIRPTSEVSGGLWDFAQAYAKLRLGKADDAKQDLEKLLKLADSVRGNFRSHSGKVLLGVVAGILEGEIKRSEGKLDDAIKSFERAVKFEDQIVYDEPEPLPFSPRHWLGAALLEKEKPDDAERVYKAELELHPLNGWSLIGLKQALAAQKKPTADVDKQLAAAWVRSDVWLRASRF